MAELRLGALEAGGNECSNTPWYLAVLKHAPAEERKESYEEKRNKKIMGISMCSVNGSSGLVRMYKERGRNQGDFGEGSGRDN